MNYGPFVNQHVKTLAHPPCKWWKPDSRQGRKTQLTLNPEATMHAGLQLRTQQMYTDPSWFWWHPHRDRITPPQPLGCTPADANYKPQLVFPVFPREPPSGFLRVAHRTQRDTFTGLLERWYKRHRWRDAQGKVWELRCKASRDCLGLNCPGNSTCLIIPNLSKPCSLGVLWKIHYIGIIKSLATGDHLTSAGEQD